jgi:hypothetical protein
MRYRGGGVGHLATRQCNEVLLADKHAPFDENGVTSESVVPMGDQFGETDTEDEDEVEGEREEDHDDEQLAGATHDTDIIAVAGFAAL